MDFPFERDPRFPRLPYSDQQQLRLRWASKRLEKNQKFLNLPEEQKLLVLQKVMSLPPVFENQQVGAGIIGAANDPQTAATLLSLQTASRAFSVPRLVWDSVLRLWEKAGSPGGQEFARNARASLSGRDAEKGAAYLQTIVEGSDSLSPIQKMLPKLAGIGGFLGDLAYSFSMTGGNPLGDVLKMFAGFGKGGAARVAALGATAIGRASFTPTTVLADVLGRVGFEAASKLAAKGASGAATMLAKWAIADLAPTVVRAGAQGLTGVLRDNFIMPMLDGRDPNTSVLDIAKTFGTYAGGDTLFWNAVAWGGPFLRLAGRTVKATFSASSKIASGLYRTAANGKRVPLTPDEMRAYEATTIHGDMPEALYGTLSPTVQDHLTAMKERQFFAANPEIAARDPVGKTVLAAGAVGLDVVQVPGKGYRVRHVTDPGVFYEIPSLSKLDSSLVDYLRKRKDLLDLDALRQDPLRGHLVRMMDAEDGIDSALHGMRRPEARADFVDATGRSAISPLEAEAARTFSGAGTRAVADTFTVPIAEPTRKVILSGEKPFALGADAVPLGKGKAPNVFAFARNVAPTEALVAAQDNAAEAIKAGSKEAPEALTAAFLRRAGFDGVNLKDGGFLALYPEKQIKFLDNTINPATGKKGFRAPVSLREENVAVDLVGVLPNEKVAGENKLLALLLKSDKGTVVPERVARASNMILKRLGAKDTRAAATILKDATEITLRETGHGLHVFLPPAMKQMPKALVQKLAEYVEDAGKGAHWRTAKGVTIPKENVPILEKFARNVIETDVRVRDWVARNAPNDEPLRALKKMAVADATPATLKTELAQWGLRVVGGEERLKLLRKGKVIAEGKTAAELLEKSGIELKIPARFMPRVVGLTPDGVEFAAKGTAVHGGPRDIWGLLDNFSDSADTAATQRIFSTAEGDVARHAQGHYVVSMPGYGIRKNFADLKEARAFLSGEWKSWNSLADRLEEAGGVLRHEGGKYVAYLGGTRTEAANLAELGEILRSIPEPAAWPELVGDDIVRYFQPASPTLDFQAFRPKYTDIPPVLEKPNFLAKISMMIKPMDAWITNYAQKIGAREVLRTYGDLQASVRVAMRDTDLMLNIVDDVQHSVGATGKKGLVKATGLFYLLGEANAEKRAAIIEQFGLAEKEFAAEKRLRAILGESATDPSGLFAKFGIDPWKFIYGYMSRVRATTDMDSILHLNQPEVTDRVLERAFGKDAIPKELKFWAEQMRTSEIISFALDTNVFSVMRRYITRGNLKLYAGEAWRTMASHLNDPNVDKVLKWRVGRYMEMLQGGGFTDGEKLMQHFSAAFLASLAKRKHAGIEARAEDVLSSPKTFGALAPDAVMKKIMEAAPGAEKKTAIAAAREMSKVAEAAHHDILRSIYSLSYTAHLGWRPYVAIRNLMQVYQTAGPLVGFTYLQRALNDLAGPRGGDIIDGVRRRGVIHQAPPIVNELATGEAFLAKLSNRALSGIKYSDDVSRAAGYVAGIYKFDDGLKIFKQVTPDNAKAFAEFTGSNLYGPDINSRVLEAAIGGNTDLARHIYANALQERALFLMRREQSPVLFHGVVGKMFGQYGTFAANYIQFVRQTIKYASPAQKAAFAARWIGVSAALAVGLNAIGLRGKDFLPWAPAQFTGGPLFNLSIDLVHSIGNDYQGRQARGELNRMLPIDLNKLIKGKGLEFQAPVGLPGYYQIRTLKQMAEYGSDGDWLKAFYALLSAPIRSE